MRYPNDRDDETSLYSRAFSVVNTTREPLAALIKHRFTSASYVDELAAQVAEEKSMVLSRLKYLEKKSNRAQTTQKLDQIMEEFPSRFNYDGLSQKAVEKLFTGYTLTSLQTILLGNNEAKKLLLKDMLTLIIGAEHSWKFFNDKTLSKNLIAYIELSDDTTQQRFATLLTATDAMKVTATRRADNKVPVIKLESFDFLKLLEIEPQNQELEHSSSLTKCEGVSF